MFHIKRFQYKASKYFKYSVTARDKIKTYVDYDTNGLDMSNYCLDPEKACPDGKDPIYDLIGVVNHMGTMVSKLLVNFWGFFKNSDNFELILLFCIKHCV